MSETFIIPLPPVSINNFYYANKRHGIRTEAREWQCNFFHYLSSPAYIQAFSNLRSNFNPSLNGYKVNLEFKIPKDKFINKNGVLSSRAIDLTNCEKSIIDILFLPKHFETEPPYGCANLNIDDKFLVGCSSSKAAGTNWEIKITIELVDLKSFCGL
jgi:hypothetical protein